MSRRVRFATDAYVRSHGRLPRGRGGWGFIAYLEVEGREVDTFFAPGNLTLAEAKAWVKGVVRAKLSAELASGNLTMVVAP